MRFKCVHSRWICDTETEDYIAWARQPRVAAAIADALNSCVAARSRWPDDPTVSNGGVTTSVGDAPACPEQAE